MRTRRIVDLAVPADHRVKLKESEKKDKFLDLARELKNLWNMKLTVMPVVICAQDLDSSEKPTVNADVKNSKRSIIMMIIIIILKDSY